MEADESAYLDLVADIKFRLENETNCNCYLDAKFIMAFLLAHNLNIDDAIKSMLSYDNCVKNIPHWFSNRKGKKIKELIKLNVTTALMETNLKHPTVVITTSARVGSNNNSFDDYLKCQTLALEVAIRRSNFQRNGCIWIIDNDRYKYWFAMRLFFPSFIKNCLLIFNAMSFLNVKYIVFLSSSSITRYLFNVFQPFLTPTWKEKVKFLNRDFDKLHELVPRKILPEEYGGFSGPMRNHDEMFLKELLLLHNL